MSRTTLSFTLFPYTTLFRSDSVRGPTENGGADGIFPRQKRRIGKRQHGEVCTLPRRKRSDLLVEPEQDRKSTRLNSSHANISYAVFCLKKKKKRKQIVITDQ